MLPSAFILASMPERVAVVKAVVPTVGSNPDTFA